MITHAHADHARWGSKRYLIAQPGLHVARMRLGDEAQIATLPYGEKRLINGVSLSFHPAGHILGSAQVRVELDGEVGWSPAITRMRRMPPVRPLKWFPAIPLSAKRPLACPSTVGRPKLKSSPDQPMVAQQCGRGSGLRALLLCVRQKPASHGRCGCGPSARFHLTAWSNGSTETLPAGSSCSSTYAMSAARATLPGR